MIWKGREYFLEDPYLEVFFYTLPRVQWEQEKDSIKVMASSEQLAYFSHWSGAQEDYFHFTDAPMSVRTSPALLKALRRILFEP